MNSKRPDFSATFERSATILSMAFMARLPKILSMRSWSEIFSIFLGSNRFFLGA